MLPAKQLGSWELYIEQMSQTKTYTGQVVEANTLTGTCLVRFSGGRVMTCECSVGALLNPGDQVLAARVPNRARLVIQEGYTDVLNISNLYRSGVAIGEEEDEDNVAGFPSTGILDNFNRRDEYIGGKWFTPPGWAVPRVISHQLVSHEYPYTTGNVGIWADRIFGPKCEVYITVVNPPSDLSYTLLFLRSTRDDRLPSTSQEASGYAFGYSHNQGMGMFLRLDAVEGAGYATVGRQEFFPFSATAPYMLGMRAVGSTIECHYVKNGVDTIVASFTDTTYPNAGYLDLLFSNDATVLDDFGGGTIV